MEKHGESTRHDLRRTDRLPCDHSVTVLWRGSLGEDKFVSAKALDISEHGVRLQMPEALQKQTYLTLSAAKLGLMGNGSVRHCTRLRGSKFAIGVEFTAGLRWIPKN